MAKRSLSRHEFIRSASSPKRRFRVLALQKSGVARLREPIAAPCYWFERHEEVVEADGAFTINPALATVTMMVDGVSAVLFYLAGPRLESCSFAFTLTPHQLANAVAAMKRARLAKHIAGAASSALENLPPGRREGLEAHLRALARSEGQRRSASKGRQRTAGRARRGTK